MKHKSALGRLNSFQIIIFGFLLLILAGSLLLMLPIASADRQWTPFENTFFTATSAVCVTGLVVHDTVTHWSFFGQAVILLLIQMGGLGVVTVAVAAALFSGRKIGLMQRSIMQDSISAPHIGGIVRLTGFILKSVFAIELVGAVAMIPSFCSRFGLRGVWHAVFHSISAFCNAGFDLMGTQGEFSSLTSLAMDPAVNIVIMLLIVIGGIGFLTWDDIRLHKWSVRRYRMQSKVVLLVSGILILLPALYFFFFEFSAPIWNDYTTGQKVLLSLFQAVTPRTAGFNTVDLTTLSDSGRALITFLMLIGGSPGSTAGGMKTTTIAVLVASAIAVFKRSPDAHLFRRRIAPEAIRNAGAILLIYLTLFFFGGIVISRIEMRPLSLCVFATASAVGTVGLSLGLTPTLSVASRWILAAMMFLGRVGGLTLVYAAITTRRTTISRLPEDRITVG